jgi:hypothetical protein
MMLSYLKGAYLSWRTAAWTTVIYVVIPLLLISIWIPESPVWLVARGRVDEAEKSLKWLAGDKVTTALPLSSSRANSVSCFLYINTGEKQYRCLSRGLLERSKTPLQ